MKPTYIFIRLRRALLVLPLLATILLFGSCWKDDDTPPEPQNNVYGSAWTTSYEGQWSLNGQALGSSVVSMWGNEISFETFPVAEILSYVSGEEQVILSDVSFSGVFYQLAGSSNVADYYVLQQPSYTFEVVIDGQPRQFTLTFSLEGATETACQMTYSRYSKVFTIMLHVARWTLNNGATDPDAQGGDTDLTLKFVTTKLLTPSSESLK